MKKTRQKIQCTIDKHTHTLGMNLAEQRKDLYNEKIKDTELKKTVGGRRTSHAQWQEELILDNIQLQKTIYKFNSILLIILMLFTTGTEKIFQKFIWRSKTPRIAKAVVNKKHSTECIIALDIKYCYIDLVIRALWYWHKLQICRPME